MNPFYYMAGIVLYAFPRWLWSKFPSKYERERQKRMDREDRENMIKDLQKLGVLNSGWKEEKK